MSDDDPLIEKFAREWHLSVPDREILAGRPLSESKLARCIAHILEVNGTYPIDWKLEEGFDGGLIERVGPKEFKITWKAEVGMCQFKTVSTEAFSSAMEACIAYGSKFFGQEFDGIAIDWKT